MDPDAIVIGDPSDLQADLNGSVTVVNGTVTVTDTETTTQTQHITRTTTNNYNLVDEYEFDANRTLVGAAAAPPPTGGNATGGNTSEPPSTTSSTTTASLPQTGMDPALPLAALGLIGSGGAGLFIRRCGRKRKSFS